MGSNYINFNNLEVYSVGPNNVPCGNFGGFIENRRNNCRTLLFFSAVIAFSVGLSVGLLLAVIYLKTPIDLEQQLQPQHLHLHQQQQQQQQQEKEDTIRTIFLKNSFSTNNLTKVSFVEQYFDENGINTQPGGSNSDDVITNGIFWGPKVEQSIPDGYGRKKHQLWLKYLQTSARAIKLENGCGRMQNRLVTFDDGVKGCVRYRQNTDQIQGELFSFYLAQILQLQNLAPSAISIINLNDPLWKNLGSEIASAQWNSNKPVVLTQYIPNLDMANIPPLFKPIEKHLNKYDIINMTNDLFDQEQLIKIFVELAQWSDLIIFDYLTANLDRIVNNLYNYQWNVNIMDAPAHNLAKKSDNNLLVFLDNESGLLHGYRLLKKYEIYHQILLENLCIFRKNTAEKIIELRQNNQIGQILRNMFDENNSSVIKDILPTLPDKSIKILSERIERVYQQIKKCESMFQK